MPSLQEQIQFVQDKYRPQLEDLQRRAQKLADDYEPPNDAEGVVGAKFKVDWKDEDIVFDVPTVKMKTNTIAIDVPEIFLVSQAIVFHTPSVRMEDKVVGRYPEWHGPFNVVWKDLIVSVPVPFLQEQRIVLDIPSVMMKRQDVKFDIPEFGMQHVKWVLRIPHFSLVEVEVEADRLKEAGEGLQNEGEALGRNMKSEIETIVSTAKSVEFQESSSGSAGIAAMYDDAIAKLRLSIDDLVAKGIDPIKVPTDGGEINLRKQLADLIERRSAALGAVDTIAA